MTPNERVLGMNIQKISKEDKEWLHALWNKAQKINNAMYMKSIGKTWKCCFECTYWEDQNAK